MNKVLLRWSGRGLLMSAALVLSLSFTTSSFAQEETKQTVALSPKVGKRLTELQALVEAKQYGAAQQQLQVLQQDQSLSSYEKAQIWNLTAYNFYLQENYQGAINAYERVLGEDIPPALRQSSLKTAAQLYFTVENYPMALERVQQLIRIIDSPSSDVLMLLGQAYFQAGRYQEALGPIKEGIDLYKAQGKTPKENWLLLLRVAYYELQDFRGMVSALNELLKYYPKDSYLLTLAGAYSELGDTKKQLVISEVLYELKVIEGSQHAVNLTNLYLMHDIPYRGAEVLSKAMNDNVVTSDERNLKLLSQAWYQAREDEKAIPPLRKAANMSGDGELFIRLAQSHLNLDQWEEAIDAIGKGFNKGGVKRPDQANTMLGMAHLNKKARDLNAAENAFKASCSDPRSKKSCEQWLAFIGNERKREETMNQVVPQGKQREQDEMLQNIPSKDDG